MLWSGHKFLKLRCQHVNFYFNLGPFNTINLYFVHMYECSNELKPVCEQLTFVQMYASPIDIASFTWLAKSLVHAVSRIIHLQGGHALFNTVTLIIWITQSFLSPWKVFILSKLSSWRWRETTTENNHFLLRRRWISYAFLIWRPRF